MSRPRNGGLPARRAVLRWGWRVYRREWRQQVLVIALLTFTVAGALLGVSVVYNTPGSLDARYGTADMLIRYGAADPQELNSQVASARAQLGTVDVIGHRKRDHPGPDPAGRGAGPGPARPVRRHDAAPGIGPVSGRGRGGRGDRRGGRPDAAARRRATDTGRPDVVGGRCGREPARSERGVRFGVPGRGRPAGVGDDPQPWDHRPESSWIRRAPARPSRPAKATHGPPPRRTRSLW